MTKYIHEAKWEQLYKDKAKDNLMNESWMLDGKPFTGNNNDYITVKIRVPVEIAKRTVKRHVTVFSAEAMRQIKTQLDNRFKLTVTKPQYTIEDIKPGLVYEFRDRRHNRYRIAAVDASPRNVQYSTIDGIDGTKQNPKRAITQRLTGNNMGPAGELLDSDTDKILTFLNDDLAFVVTKSTWSYEEAMDLP